MMRTSSTKKILTIAFFLLTFSFNVNAQTPPPPTNLPTAESFLGIKTIPKNPGPNQKVVASLDFYLTDLKKANVAWYLNGKLIEKKIGKTSFEFKTGNLGSLSVVNVVVDTFEGEVFQEEIAVRLAEVNLVANAETYIPPFYKGRKRNPGFQLTLE